MFYVGSIFQDELTEEELNSEREYHFLLCKIIIGNSFCKIYQNKGEIDDFSVDGMESKPISLYIIN